MAPKRHNKKAAPNIKVLMENSELLLTQRMNWAVDKVKMFKKQKQRALIYLRDSETASMLNEKLSESGFISKDISNIDSSPIRNRVVLDFNNENYETDVLVTTYEASKGFEFYGACRRGLIFEYPGIMDDYVAAIKCLDQNGQKEPAEWFNCYIHGTMDVMHDLILTRSAVARIMPDVEKRTKVPHDLGLICAYHAVAVALGQSSSRYPRSRVHWSNMESDEIKREGLFYAAVAKFLEENQGSGEKFTADTMAKIAKSWKPESKLTKEHVNCELPEHKDGVVLYNYVIGGYKEGML
ncbi:hypothetical protein DER45DRAFT_608061 [Fusarium avenaceum]|nr:hypothetical protein DER45DRAFT_608061 [Fusarium avenaceum]